MLLGQAQLPKLLLWMMAQSMQPLLFETAGAILVSHLVNQGYDRSILSGLAKAKAMGFHFCVTMDADGQHPKNKLEEFFEKLEKGNQLVIGRRQGFQRFGEWVFGLVSQYVWEFLTHSVV